MLQDVSGRSPQERQAVSRALPAQRHLFIKTARVPVKPIGIAACLLLSWGAREAWASCAASDPYAFPPAGKVLPNPTLFTKNVVRVLDARGGAMPFVQVPFGVRIEAGEGTTFTIETLEDPPGSKAKFGPYQVTNPDPSEVAPVDVVEVARYSSGSPDPVQAVVLTVPTAADAYQLEVENLPSGTLKTLIVPSRRAQYWGKPAEAPAYLDIGFIDCRNNFDWVAPGIRVRVAALRTDGKKSPYSAPLVIRAPIPMNSPLPLRMYDAVVDRPVPFAAATAALLSVVAWVISRISRRSPPTDSPGAAAK